MIDPVHIDLHKLICNSRALKFTSIHMSHHTASRLSDLIIYHGYATYQMGYGGVPTPIQMQVCGFKVVIDNNMTPGALNVGFD